jgi:glycosyltransferase involved in cell wall biosynthesis
MPLVEERDRLVKLAIDLTPTSINRTAIYHIALDVAAALRDRAVGFRYGTSYRTAPVEDPAALAAIGRRVLATLGDKRLLSHERRRPAGIHRLLILDPLYVLLEDLRPEDTVLVLDLSTVTNPEWHSPHIAALYRVAFHRLAASGAGIACISESTALALWANFGVPLDTVTVIPLYLRPGAGPNGDETSSDANGKLLLCVGSLEERKNLRGLFRAFEASGLAEDGYRLAVVGGPGVGAELIRHEAGVIPGIELRGFVKDAELRQLYREAAGFVLPSLLEGFGLPVLEAASWGLPILTSLIGATAEVAPGGSILVDPYDIEAIARGLCELARIPAGRRRAIAATNRQHAAGYSFPRFLSALGRAMERPSGTHENAAETGIRDAGLAGGGMAP